MKIKMMGSILLLTCPLLAWSERLVLGQFDQSHLANFVGRLPAEHVSSKTEQIDDPVRGQKITTTFEPAGLGFSFDCWQKYYNDSPWPSFSGCKVYFDLNNPMVRKKNDEVWITLEDSLAEAFYDTIPYGRPERKLYSFDKETGTTYQGVKDSNIFNYFFTCSKKNCDLLFSAKQLKPDD